MKSRSTLRASPDSVINETRTSEDVKPSQLFVIEKMDFGDN